MGQEIGITQFNDETFKEFDRRLVQEAELLQSELAKGSFSDTGEICGYELESWLVDHNYFPSPINQDFLTKLNNPLVVPELSRFNVELNGLPLPLQGRVLTSMAEELGHTWQLCQEQAHELDSVLLMIGILPTIRQKDLCLANMSDLKRYRALNEQVLARRAGRPIRICIEGREHLNLDHPDLMLEAATTSFQIHLQTAQRDAVRYFNAALISAGPLVAASGNSPLLFNADLWDETRIPLFEQSVEIGDNATQENRRVSFGRGYACESLFECFDDNLSTHSVLLPILMDSPPEQFAHLRLHNGTIWRWIRPLIGFDADGIPHLRIEQRVLPAGPSIVDMLANSAIYFGISRFLATLRDPPEAVFGFEKARSNFYAAARYGLHANLTWLDGSVIDARTLLLEEILPMAWQGLEMLNIDANDIDFYSGIMKARIHSGQTGAAWQRAYRQKYNADNLHLVAAYLERQRSGVPVHEWEV
jgi:hypothetical protein